MKTFSRGTSIQMMLLYTMPPQQEPRYLLDPPAKKPQPFRFVQVGNDFAILIYSLYFCPVSLYHTIHMCVFTCRFEQTAALPALLSGVFFISFGVPTPTPPSAFIGECRGVAVACRSIVFPTARSVLAVVFLRSPR